MRGPDGRRLAKRHGAVTLSDRGEGPDEVRAWMARSLGLAEAGETPAPYDLLARFDPDRLPREPTVWSPESAAQAALYGTFSLQRHGDVSPSAN